MIITLEFDDEDQMLKAIEFISIIFNKHEVKAGFVAGLGQITLDIPKKDYQVSHTIIYAFKNTPGFVYPPIHFVKTPFPFRAVAASCRIAANEPDRLVFN